MHVTYTTEVNKFSDLTHGRSSNQLPDAFPGGVTSLRAARMRKCANVL